MLNCLQSLTYVKIIAFKLEDTWKIRKNLIRHSGNSFAYDR